MLEDREGAGPLSDFDRLRLRRLRRRVCDACGRQGTLEVERFPVCYCGARRYCNEACQLVDWDRGHSATCASGHTFPQSVLDTLGEIKENWRNFKGLTFENVTNDESFRDWMYQDFPPPADRVR